jgi:N utilization substance protein B
MSLSPQKFREIVFQVLYSQDIGNPDPALITNLIMAELAISRKNVRMAQERVVKIIEQLPFIDEHISSVSTSYDFERIQTVTKNILRLAVYELFFDDTIPPKVVIAEAIRLSRKFNTPESASFVNALLENLYHQKLGVQGDDNQLKEVVEDLLKSEEASLEAAKKTKMNKRENADDNLQSD